MSPAALAQNDWAALQKGGSAALDANKYWLGEPLLKMSISDAEKCGFDNPGLATCLGELGRLYTIRRRYSEAEPLLERELAVREMILGKQDGKIVSSMGSLITFYLNYGTIDKAEPLTDDMLAFLEGKMQESHARPDAKRAKGAPLEGWCGDAPPRMVIPLMDWAVTCDSVGNAYRCRGKYELAEKLFKASLDMKTTILGKGHLSLAHTFDHLGCLYLDPALKFMLALIDWQHA